jgi:hypothetical protein
MPGLFEDVKANATDTENIEFFLRDGQNPAFINDIYPKARSMMMVSERLVNIFHQVNVLAPTALILTTQRLIIQRRNIWGGSKFIIFFWYNIDEPEAKEGLFLGSVYIVPRFGADDGLYLERRFWVHMMPKVQSRHCYALVEEQAQWWHDQWRYRKYDSNRQRSGAVVFKGAMASMNATHRSPIENYNIWPVQKTSVSAKDNVLPTVTDNPLPLSHISNPVPLHELDFEAAKRKHLLGIDERGREGDMAKLLKLKKMFEAGLITREEHDQKRAQIFEKM